MKEIDAVELAYNNGYSRGYEDGYNDAFEQVEQTLSEIKNKSEIEDSSK